MAIYAPHCAAVAYVLMCFEWLWCTQMVVDVPEIRKGLLDLLCLAWQQYVRAAA